MSLSQILWFCNISGTINSIFLIFCIKSYPHKTGKTAEHFLAKSHAQSIIFFKHLLITNWFTHIKMWLTPDKFLFGQLWVKRGVFKNYSFCLWTEFTPIKLIYELGSPPISGTTLFPLLKFLLLLLLSLLFLLFLS